MKQIIVPDRPVPGRYEVIGFVGRKSELVHRWTSRREAEENAEDLISEGYSQKWGERFTKVQVMDRINRTLLFEQSRAVKRYG